MSQRLSNVFWYDFLHYNSRLLMHFDERLEKMKRHIHGLPDISDLYTRICHSRNNLAKANRMLEKITRSDRIGTSSEIDTNMEFDNTARDLAIGISDLMIMMTQKVYQLEMKEPSNSLSEKLQEIVHFLKVPDTTLIGSRRIMKECVESVYGPDTNRDDKSPELAAVCFGYPDYRYLAPSKLVCIAPSDATQLCRWATLIHETMHSKLDMVMNAETSAARAFGSWWKPAKEEIEYLADTFH
jgi:hypothetical protein